MRETGEWASGISSTSLRHILYQSTQSALDSIFQHQPRHSFKLFEIACNKEQTAKDGWIKSNVNLVP